jgi:hypothetical protein
VIENFRIRVFRTVAARHLNFSWAAEELFLTQPAVKQQLRLWNTSFVTASRPHWRTHFANTSRQGSASDHGEDEDAF